MLRSRYTVAYALYIFSLTKKLQIVEEDLYFPGSVTSLALAGNDSTTSLSTSSLSTNQQHTPRQSHELSSTEHLGVRSRKTSGLAENVAGSSRDRLALPLLDTTHSSYSSNSDLPKSANATEQSEQHTPRSPSRKTSRKLRPKTSVGAQSTGSLIPERFSRRRSVSANSPRIPKDQTVQQQQVLPSPEKLNDDGVIVSSLVIPLQIPFTSNGGFALPSFS